MEKEWKIKNQAVLDFREIAKDYHPVILRLLGNRGFKTSEEIKKFFEFDYDADIHNPFLFPQMEQAVKRIMAAKDKKEKVAIFGDYDADGVTASALLFETLKNLGFTEVITYIPDRQIEGYGMNQEALNFLQKEKVDLIITVDCGITNREEVKLAKDLGIDLSLIHI